MKGTKLRKIKSSAIGFFTGAIFCYIMILTGISETINQGVEKLFLNLAVLVMFIAIAVVTTYFAIKNLNKYKSINKIINVLYYERKISIYELAPRVNMQYDKTRNIVAEIIRNNLMEIYIDEDENIVVKTQNKVQESYEISDEEKINEKKILKVECKNCGASNKFIEGKENRCEYCDSILEIPNAKIS